MARARRGFALRPSMARVCAGGSVAASAAASAASTAPPGKTRQLGMKRCPAPRTPISASGPEAPSRSTIRLAAWRAKEIGGFSLGMSARNRTVASRMETKRYGISWGRRPRPPASPGHENPEPIGSFMTSRFRSALHALALTTATPALALTTVGGAPMGPTKGIGGNAVNSKDHATRAAAVKAAGRVQTLYATRHRRHAPGQRRGPPGPPGAHSGLKRAGGRPERPTRLPCSTTRSQAIRTA